MKKENNEKIEVETLLNDSNVPTEVIEKITSIIEEKQHIPVTQTEEVDTLKIKLMEEKNWRKKAAIAAMIISKSIE